MYGPNREYEASRTLWAGCLPPYVDETFLYSLFIPTGGLISARVVRERQTGQSQGFAFLEFDSHSSAESVLNAYDGKQIPATNHVLRLNWAGFGLGRSAEGAEGTESYSLFVGDLATEVTDLTLQRHFQQYFRSVSSAKVITERSTGRSKGYGFVRFASSAERDRALACMEGQRICNRAIRVSQATAKKYQGDGLFHPSDEDPTNTTAFVGNINSDVTEEDLNQVFRRCGDIVSIKLLRARGCAFVVFAERSSAVKAIGELHGKVIKNCAIRLCWGRRNSQLRGQLQEAHMPLSQYSDLGIPGSSVVAPMGLLHAGPAVPQPGIVDAALHAASMSTPAGFSSHQQVAGPPAAWPGTVMFPPMYPTGAHSMSDALQALANLNLGNASTPMLRGSAQP